MVIVDLDKNAEKALNVALNKISGEWDDEKLCDLLQDLDLSGYDFSLTGFTRSELDGLQLKLGVGEAVEDEDFDVDKAVEECEKPVTKRGDLWIMGGHRLLCGDARNVDDMARLMGGAKADLLLTDPPYNVDYVGKTKDALKIDNDRMSNADFRAFLLEAFTAARQSMKAGAAFYIWHADSNGYDFRGACMDAGWKVRQCLIWEKDILVLGRQDYQWRHEPILYGWKEGAAHYFVNDRTQDTVILEDEADLKGMKKQELLAFIEKIFRDFKDRTTVHFENKPSRNALHPTMKPVPLVGRLMNNSSKPGWLVGDFFGGSGTTLMAAEQLGRTAYLMESDPRNVDVIVRRWEAYTGKEAVLTNE